MDDEEIMRQINAKGNAGDADLEDELAGLEAELEKEENKPKNDSDDELANLEKEGLDDVDEEEKPKVETKPKPEKKPLPQPPQPQPQKKAQPQINKQELKKAVESKPNPAASSSEDLYPEKVENKYHDVQKTTSLGVLEKEKSICDNIIAYKKKIGQDFDTWDLKKQSLDDKIQIVTSTIQDGIWDFEIYKKKIQEQYKWEKKLLQFVEKDPTLNPKQKDVIRQRVNDRLKIIEDELTRNPDEEAAAEEEEKSKEEKPKEMPKKEPEKPTSDTKPEIKSTSEGSKKEDFYPEKTEAKYHNVQKMTSLGTLEKEKVICDTIIAYKKKIGEDYESWAFKKDSIDDRIQIITSTIQDGIWDFEMYKKKIQEQYKWESKLLQFVEKDPSLSEKQKKVLKERVNIRKKIIEEELTKNPEGEEDEEEGGEEPKEEIKPKVEETKKKKEELLTKKSLNPVFEVPKDKEEEEKKRLTEVVQDRLNEYRNALDYFKKNEMSERQKPAIECAKQICIELKKIQDGKWREVNEFKLPDPVTPEFIYGYSKEERFEKFKKIITEMNNQKLGVQEEMNQKMEAFKKLSKAQFKKIEAAAKKDMDALKLKKAKYEKIVALLKEKLQDKWVPAPLYLETQEEVRKEKINKDIPDNTVRLIFGKTTYSKKDRLYLIVKLSEKNLEKKFDQSHPGDWTGQVDFQTDDFRSLFRTKVDVEIYEKKTIFKDRYKGRFEIDLKPLKTQSEFSKECKIILDSGREGTTANVEVKTRVPCKEKEYITETKPVFQVTKIYPPFDIKGVNKGESIKLDVQTQKVTADDLKVHNPNTSSSNTTQKVQKTTPSQANVKTKQGVPVKKPGGGAPKPHIDKSEFTEEELRDPDCINCLNTLQVLEFKLNKYEEISKKIDGRTPRELMQRIVKIKCKKNSLTEALGDDIGPEDYIQLLRSTFEKDKKLVTYFNQIKDAEKSKLVSERLPLIIKETEELMKQMPK